MAARVERYDRSHLLRAMTLVGLEEPGPPIRVLLVVEDSPEARSAPRWATGYAYSGMGIVVLIPSREPSYPHGSLESLLHHEVAHVLIGRAARGHPVPRWFDEGVAMTAARSWNFEDRARIIYELLPGGRPDLDRIDTLFQGGPSEAERAYAVSGAFVRDLIQQHGLDLPARILDRVGEGTSFEEAFRESAGLTLREAESSFYARQNIWNRWVPFLSSSLSIWTIIMVIAVCARRARRAKDARKKAEWDREESAGEAILEGSISSEAEKGIE